jgi:hypothetical protein
MFTSTKNFDASFLQLRSNYSRLQNPLRKDYDGMVSLATDMVVSQRKLKPQIENRLPDLFNLRLKAINWLIADSDIDLLAKLDEVSPQIEELKQNTKLDILADNILFALRANRQVVVSFMRNEDMSQEALIRNFSEQSIINYEQFEAAIAIGVPDNETATMILEWTNASLYIEFIALAATLINAERLKVATKTIHELEFLIAEASH